MARKPVLPPERTHLVLERVVSLYENGLADCPEARKWLMDRRIGDGALVSRHRVGYSSGALGGILPAGGTLHEELRALGIFDGNGRERLTGCLVFPMADAEGHIRSLYGTELATGKSVFLPEVPAGIWNAAVARLGLALVVTATVPDALAIEAAGLGNVIAMPDRARLTAQDLKLFAECQTETLDFVVPEADGWSGTIQAIRTETGDHCRCRVRVPLYRGSVTEFLKRGGPKALASWLATDPPPTAPRDATPAPPPDASLNLSFAGRRYEVLGIEKGNRGLKATIRALDAGKVHIDTVDLYNARSRRALVRDLALVFDRPHELAEADVVRLIGACEQWHPPADGAAPSAEPPVVLTAAQRAEGEAFGQSPRLVEAILEDYAACGLIGEEPRKLLCYLAAVSRKMDTPLSVLLLASSGAGKSAIQAASLAFCPEEDVVRVTSLTGKALFYRDATSLRHRILAVEEGTGAADADYAIRSLISSGELTMESVSRDAGSGVLKAVSRRVYGPTAVFYTVTNPEVDPETRSRFFVIGVDESCRQTSQILATQRARQTLDGLADELRVQAIREKHRSFQRLLRPLAVVNPYAGQLTYGDDRLQARRDQPKYLNLIRAVAFLRQMTKEVRQCIRGGATVDYIDVEPADIETASRLAAEVLGTRLDELSMPARDLLGLLGQLVTRRMAGVDGPGSEPPLDHSALTFTRREVREFAGWNPTRLHMHLRELLDLEYVVVAARSLHGLQRYRLLYAGQGCDGARFLIGLRENLADRRRPGVSDPVSAPTVAQKSGAGQAAITQKSPGNHPEITQKSDIEHRCNKQSGNEL